MKLQSILTAIMSLASLVAALPAANMPRNDVNILERDAEPRFLSTRDTFNGNEIDLPAFITALFNGLANTILATGDAAANTIAATGGAIANANGGAETNSTLMGRSIGEQVGGKVAAEMAKRLAGVTE